MLDKEGDDAAWWKVKELLKKESKRRNCQECKTAR
jgi:hypothetical protein